MSAATNIPEPQAVSLPVLKVPESAEFHRRMGSISRQATVYFAGTILTAAAGYFFKIYLARVLGAEALGLYALGMSIVGFVGLFVSIGLPSAATRFVAEYHSRGEFSRLGAFLRGSLLMLFVGGMVLGGLVLWAGPWISVRFYHAPALTSYFRFFVLIMFFGALTTFLGQAMAGYRDVARRTIITNFIGTPANILVAVILISLGFGLRGYLAAQVASALLVLALLGAYMWKLTPREARAGKQSVRIEKKVIAFSLTAFGIATVDFLLTQSDKIVLGYYLRPKQVGVYAVAMALVAFVPIVLTSVNQIFSPTIAELHATGDHALLQKLYATLTKWILILTLPLALTIIFFSRPLIGMFGHGFEAGAAVLVIGTVGQLFNCAVGSVGFLLLMSGNQLRMIKIQACNAVLMISLSLLLVPRFGIIGAAVASTIAVIVTNLWSLVAVLRTLKLFPYNAGYKKLAPATFCSMAVLLALLHASSRMNSIWILAAAALLCAYGSFLGALWLFGLEPDDRRLAAVAWSRVETAFRKGVTW